MEGSLHVAYKHLASVAVFIEQATVDERLADNEHVSFETELRQLEDDYEMGLYWLLCALHRAIHVAGGNVDHEVVAEVRRIRVLNVDRNAMRHIRDYLVLRDFERLLNRLSIEFTVLRYIYMYLRT